MAHSEGVSVARASEQSGTELAAAHQALVSDPNVQFQLPPITPPPPPPAWAKAVGEWLRWLVKPLVRLFQWLDSLLPAGIIARLLFWGLIALVVGLAVMLIVQRLRTGQWRLPRRAPRTAPVIEEDGWQPEAMPVRRWLEEAEALAAAGRYAEAAHHLLRRSIDDIAARRPQLVQPALTSRELARAEAVPAPARGLFAGIAGLVERSLFGGRAVSAEDWRQARDAYARFTLGQAWQG
ncbi:MAG: DUF4129 domain-containing protein [Sphingomonas sp.]|uniref:DUF4129 domain-containing protein n=1 Tax=Sphingomonas sp. TaxID=28214 RepID=UPI0025CEF627|nr:DUF4129 domain-containing protein [Sphingomonas sp.]MBX9881878.1 DUF4129 domain-containing protein [Sphingomonas sp.]